MKSHIPIAALIALTLTACGSGGGGDGLPPIDDPAPPPANQPPGISGTPGQSVMVGQGYAFAPAASDADGDSLTFSINNQPAWTSFDGGTGALSGIPSMADVGTHDAISIAVSDGKDAAELPSFAITVIGNQPPVISGTPAQLVIAGQSYVFTPVTSDADGDSLTFSIINRPDWASFDTGTGTLTGTPTSSDIGAYPPITISVSDGTDTATLPSFTITVIVGNQPPVISGTPGANAMAGSAYAFIPMASDPDGDSLTFSIVNRPDWASFDTGTGTLTGTPTSSDIGAYPLIRISVSDGTDTATLPSFTITVIGGNQPPDISGTPDAEVMAGSAYAFIPVASDPDGDSLTFSVANLPGWASFEDADGTLTGTPSAADIGTYSGIVIMVTDGTATAALDAFAITVTDSATGSALLEWTPPTLNLDDTILTDLAGFTIYYGTSSGNYTNTVDVPSAGASSTLVENLPPATYFFVVTAYDTLGNESDHSNEVSKVVP